MLCAGEVFEWRAVVGQSDGAGWAGGDNAAALAALAVFHGNLQDVGAAVGNRGRLIDLWVVAGIEGDEVRRRWSWLLYSR